MIRLLRYRTLGALVGFCCFSAHVSADPAEDFRMGVEAFNAGQFEAARQSFSDAKAAGLESPALMFNLGSTYYRLRRFDEAADAFAQSGQDPAWAMLSRYNQGLVAWEQGDRQRAAGFFSEVAKHSGDARLTAAALLMWERVDPLARLTPRTRLAANLGYDSNVILTDLPQSVSASGKSDIFTEFLAKTGAWIGRGADSPTWEASFYDVRYSDLNDYNLTQVSAGLDKPWSQGRWVHLAGVQLRQLWLDGAGFQRIESLRGATIFSANRDRLLRGDLRFSQVDSLGNRYDFLKGQEIDVELSWTETFSRSWLAYGLTYAQNDRKDQTSGADFYSYSPTRLGGWIRGSWSLGSRWVLSPSFRFRNSRYSGTDRHGGVAQAREDNDWQLGTVLTYRWTPTWSVTTEYQFSKTDSNFPDYSYTRHVVQIGAARAF